MSRLTLFQPHKFNSKYRVSEAAGSSSVSGLNLHQRLGKAQTSRLSSLLPL
ncbi:MAG: hypothetical protein ACRD32_00410 [Nitrososphaerales archaeon]